MPGQGSRFRVRLMLSAARNPLPAPAPERPLPIGYDGPERRVLVADDDADHRRLLGDLLEPLGFAVFNAEDGGQALELAALCRPDLLLVDVSMPGLDGWTVARMLRERGFDRLVIMVISASADLLRRPHAGGGGPEHEPAHDDVLEKPIVLSELVSRIGSRLGLRWMSGAATAAPPALPAALCLLAPEERAALQALAGIGYVRGLLAALDAIAAKDPARAEGIAALRRLVSGFELEAFVQALGPDVDAAA